MRATSAASVYRLAAHYAVDAPARGIGDDVSMAIAGREGGIEPVVTK